MINVSSIPWLLASKAQEFRIVFKIIFVAYQIDIKDSWR